MNTEYKELLLKSGFKVFGDKVVGADNGSSGNVTKSIAAFYCYVTEPLEAKLDEQDRLIATLRSIIGTSAEAEQRLIQQMEESFARQN